MSQVEDCIKVISKSANRNIKLALIFAEIARLDPFEGTPFRYSRERFPVQTECGVVPAWTYIANPAVIDHAIRPARWYIEHLLAGRDYLSPAYWEKINNTVCCEGVTIVW